MRFLEKWMKEKRQTPDPLSSGSGMVWPQQEQQMMGSSENFIFPDQGRIVPVELETTMPVDSTGRYRALYEATQKFQQIHSPEYLSSLELKELLEKVPEGMVVKVNID